jgi:nucleoside-diphosphate-sugar epimerase
MARPVKILVAGGAGYLGSVLVPRLLERGYDVRVADLLWYGNHLPPGVPVLQKDVLELAEEDLAGCRQVVFLAGISNDPMAEYSPHRNFVMNGAAPAYLAWLARRAGVERFVYGSSCSIYGYSTDRLCGEDDPTVSRFPYGISKLQGEVACLQLAEPGFSVISLRKGTVCGWSPRMRLDLVVNTMFKTALESGRILVRNPAIWRPVLAIQDAAAAYVLALEAAPEVSGIFNVASGNYTVGELGDGVKEAIERRLGRPIELEIRDEHDLRSYKVAIDKAARVLSFHPRHDVGDIVAELFAHLPEFEDFGNPKYSNIAVFRRLEEEARERATAALATPAAG